ncbi:MAG: Protein UmuC [Desulfovibrio sp.]
MIKAFCSLPFVLLDMHTEEAYFKASASVTLAIPTNITTLLIKAAHEALDKCYQPGHGFLKGGIFLFDLQEQGSRQLTLMESLIQPKQQKQTKLMKTLDSINDRYGRDTIRYLAQGPTDAFWHMQRNKKSGAYTTRWNELATVKS